MRVTGSMGVVGNLVEGVTDAGILLAGDADADIEFNSIDGDGDGLRLTPDGGTVVSSRSSTATTSTTSAAAGSRSPTAR